jgi:hypothetical protein
MPGPFDDPDKSKPPKVRVSIRNTDRLRGLSYLKRKEVLSSWMENLIVRLSVYNAEIIPATLSPLGQSVEAEITEDDFSRLQNALVTEEIAIEQIDIRNAEQH